LDLAETKCFTLKSELSYMIGVCRKAQTEIKGSKGSSDTCKSLTVLQKPIISPHKNLILKSPVEHHDYNNEITATNKIPSHNILDRICNIEQNAEENFGNNFFKSRLRCLNVFRSCRCFPFKPKIRSIFAQKKH